MKFDWEPVPEERPAGSAFFVYRCRNTGILGYSRSIEQAHNKRVRPYKCCVPKCGKYAKSRQPGLGTTGRYLWVCDEHRDKKLGRFNGPD
jgi:hypothetical protein